MSSMRKEQKHEQNEKISKDLLMLFNNFGAGLEEFVNSKWGFVYGSHDGDWCASIRL